MAKLPLQQKALLLEENGNLTLSHNKPIPVPGFGQILIRVKAAAVNPSDGKVNKYKFVEEFPAVLGLDIAGDVVAIGEGVTKFKTSDRVMAQGIYNNDFAAFQEYALAEESYTAKIPPNISYDQAAALPVAAATSYIAFYNQSPHGMGLASPLGDSGLGYYSGNPIVVFGGAASIGQAGIQYAKLSGFSPIIATASLKHTDHLKSLGATNVLDRNLSASELKSEINKITNQPIKYVYDTISSPETQNTGIELLASGGHLMVVQPSVVTPNDKHVSFSTALRQLECNSMSFTSLYNYLTELVENGSIKPNKVEILPGGLNGVTEGLRRLKESKVSGVKLILHPEETAA